MTMPLVLLSTIMTYLSKRYSLLHEYFAMDFSKKNKIRAFGVEKIFWMTNNLIHQYLSFLNKIPTTKNCLDVKKLSCLKILVKF